MHVNISVLECNLVISNLKKIAKRVTDQDRKAALEVAIKVFRELRSHRQAKHENSVDPSLPILPLSR